MGRPARTLLAWLACAAIATGLVGCAPTADMEQLQANESALRGMVANDRQQMDSLQEQVARLNDRLTELEHNGGTGGGGSGSAALEQRVSKLESQTASAQAAATAVAPAASAAVPETSNISGAAGSPAAPGAATAEGVGTGPETTAGAGAGATGAGPPAGTAIASAAPPPAGAPRPAAPPPAAPPPTMGAPSWRAELDRELVTPYSDSAVKLYRSGLADIKAAQYPQGAAKLQELQHKFPKSELSEPAEYFCANALYESGKYDQSILQFNDLTMRFPTGKYASASLLREAQAFMKINDRIDARLTLQKLIGDHPNSPETPQARSMMQMLASG